MSGVRSSDPAELPLNAIPSAEHGLLKADGKSTPSRSIEREFPAALNVAVSFDTSQARGID
jgi:hypothetical protein